MKTSNRIERARSRTLALLCLASWSFGCAGIKAAVPMDVNALRSGPSTAIVGYQSAMGVPSLADRVAERPGLKLAILQVAYKIEGRPEMTFVSDMWSFGRVSRWTETTTPEILVPTSLAQQSAVHLTRKLEEALAAQGFEVVSHEAVSQTPAYAKYYGDYPIGYNLENGWTVVGAHPLKVKKVENLIDFGTLNWVWPDTEALPEIKDDLGEDVLFLNLQVQIGTMQGGSGGINAATSVDVNDPDFVGYGVGGFGHAVVSMNANTGAKVPVPGFIEREGDLWKSNWTPIYEDLERIHRAFAAGFASQLKELAYPASS